MKLASIVPMKDVAHTFDGDYAMLLAHLKDYYPEKRNRNCYVIMDNSLIELGGAVNVETVYNAAKQCGADEFILPDVFQDADATIQKVVESIWWLYSHGHMDEFRLMAVCQGETIEDFIRCFKRLNDIPEIHCIGIPKVAAGLSLFGRPGLEPIWQNSRKAIHLLGCWNNLSELTEYERPSLIRSCDTCIPALLSTRDVSFAWTDRPEKTIDLINDQIHWDSYSKIMEQLMERGLV